MRASVGAVDSNELTITANNAPQITVTAAPTTVAENVPVTLTYNVTADTNTALRSVFIDFGDGQSQLVGTARSGSITHVYRRSGTFVVEAEVIDKNNEKGTGSTAVVVTPAPPLLADDLGPAEPGAHQRADDDHGDADQQHADAADHGSHLRLRRWLRRAQNGSTTTTHVYTRVGDFPLTVTVRLNDGRSATGTLGVVVIP